MFLKPTLILSSHFRLCPLQNAFNLRDFLDCLNLEGGTACSGTLVTNLEGGSHLYLLCSLYI